MSHNFHSVRLFCSKRSSTWCFSTSYIKRSHCRDFGTVLCWLIHLDSSRFPFLCPMDVPSGAARCRGHRSLPPFTRCSISLCLAPFTQCFINLCWSIFSELRHTTIQQFYRSVAGILNTVGDTDNGERGSESKMVRGWCVRGGGGEETVSCLGFSNAYQIFRSCAYLL